jgi:hypothetical protein
LKKKHLIKTIRKGKRKELKEDFPDNIQMMVLFAYPCAFITALFKGKSEKERKTQKDSIPTPTLTST